MCPQKTWSGSCPHRWVRRAIASLVLPQVTEIFDSSVTDVPEVAKFEAKKRNFKCGLEKLIGGVSRNKNTSP